MRRFFVVGREHEKETFRFVERNASFYFFGTFRFVDYIFAKFLSSYQNAMLMKNMYFVVLINNRLRKYQRAECRKLN